MAAPAENSPSLKNRTRIRESTLTKQRELCMNQSKVMHLQQHLQELRNRERQAQLHNKQLLQQFERAQVTLKEVLARNAAMKTIRMEYERYLEENAPRWQQQLQEKTRAAQKKRLEDSLKSFLKKEEAQVLMSTTDGPSRGFATEALKCSAPQTCPQENLDSNQDSFSYCPHTQSHAGECPGVLKGPHLPHTPFLFPPHSFLLHHLTSTPGHYHHPWSEQDEAGWNDPGSEAAGFPSGCLDRLSREKPPASRVSQTSGEENETRGSQVSNKEKAGGSCLSSDLDVKPVRLPSDHAGSSDSSTDSSQTCRQKRKKKRRRTQPSSSGSERCGSFKSSIKMIPSSFVLHHNSERNFSSEAGGSRGSRRTERSGSDGSPKSERVEEQSRKESQHVADEDEGTSEKMEDETDEGSRSNSVKTQTQEEEATEHQERNSSEQSSIGEKDEEHRKENVKSGDEDERCDVETDKENSSEEDDDGKEEEDEESEKLKHKDTEIRQEESSQDEDEDGSEGSENEEEEAEQSGDSEDIIIVPQEKRSKQMKMIPEEDEAKTQSENESSEEDIENLLAPQEQRKNKDKDVKADRKLKATRHSMSIFQVSEEKWRTAPKNDSDEFDHFYD